MRNRTPKMLVFPDLGSKAEVAYGRPGASGCPVEQTTLSGNQKQVNTFFADRKIALKGQGFSPALKTTKLNGACSRPSFHRHRHIRRMDRLVTVIRIHVQNRQLIRSRSR